MKPVIVGVLIFMLIAAGTYATQTDLAIPGIPGNTSSPDYIIYNDAGGNTVARTPDSPTIKYSSPTDAIAIQQAIDASPGGTVLIRAGLYNIANSIISTKSTSIMGEGNATILRATSGLYDSVIAVHGGDKVTISNLQVDGNKAVQTYGNTIRGIEFLDVRNGVIDRVYSHSVISGQGVYLSNSHYCTIKNSWIDNIGDNLGSGSSGNYGSGIAFGEESQVKVASSHILIENVHISRASMSSIDLEPANNVQIRNCHFTGGVTWKGIPTPCITMYNMPGYSDPCDNLEVTGNIMTGAFGEFVILTNSKGHLVKDNVITYTTTNDQIAIWGSNAQSSEISGNTVNTVSKGAIITSNCKTFVIKENKVTDMSASKNDYGIRVYANGGTSSGNVISGNTVTGFGVGVNNDGSTLTTITNNAARNCAIPWQLSGSGTHSGNTIGA